MLLAVYLISIKKPTGKHLYNCFNLCSDGILSDSTHIRSIIVYHSFCEDRHRSSYLVHQHGSCFRFSFVISKVMTSHENALFSQYVGHAQFVTSCILCIVCHPHVAVKLVDWRRWLLFDNESLEDGAWDVWLICSTRLVPRPHPLMKRNSLVKQVKFLRLVTASPINVYPKKVRIFE